MKHRTKVLGALLAFALGSAMASGTALAQQPAKKPNIIVIMVDDVGAFNIGAYHRGVMSGKTPNLDKLAEQGMMFTDYYAEASCTDGRTSSPANCRYAPA
jgi:phosphoglycerol transferase MdoB-like AlkP superfamily enzyme